MEEMHRAKYVGRTQSSLTFPRYLRILTNLKACQIPFFRFGRGFIILGFPGGSDGKESASNAREPGSVNALGRSSEGGHGNPLQYSCLENSMDRGACWATVHEVTKSWTWLSDFNWLHHWLFLINSTPALLPSQEVGVGAKVPTL